MTTPGFDDLDVDPPEPAVEDEDGQDEVPEVQGEEMPAPGNPMAVARRAVDEFQQGGALTLRRWRGGWMRWQGTHWAEVEDTVVRARLYERLEHAQYQHIDPKTGVPELRPWHPNRRKMADLIDALTAVTHLPETVNPPTWLTANGGSTYRGRAGQIIACTNGLLDVAGRDLHDLTPEFFNMVSVPFDCDPGAPEPQGWLRFLSELWPADLASIDLLQEFFGYVLSGRTDLQKILMLIGPTRSGKGTIARILTALVGKGNVAGPTLDSLGTNFGLSPLLGKPLALVSDARLGKGNVNQVVERLLSISGEDTLTVDRKFRDPWTGKLSSRFVLLSNELPNFGDASGAIANRFLVLTMERSWLGKENSNLTDELIPELPGILMWALDGLDRLVKHGRFTNLPSSTAAVSAMQDLGSPVSAFVRNHCQHRGEVPVADLFAAWKDWCEENGHRAGSAAMFGRNLRAVMPGLRVSQPRDGESRERVYVGLSLSTTHNGADRVPSRASDNRAPEMPDPDVVARDGTRSNPLQPQQESRPTGQAAGPASADFSEDPGPDWEDDVA